MDASQPESQPARLLKKNILRTWGDAQRGTARGKVERTGSFFNLLFIFYFFHLLISTFVCDSVHCIALHYITYVLSQHLMGFGHSSCRLASNCCSSAGRDGSYENLG